MSEATPLPAPPVAVAPIAAAPPVLPPKIKSLTLCDFRAFAGPEPVTFRLDGKNLLIYGENGSGKSSVFHALDEFFFCRPPWSAGPQRAVARVEKCVFRTARCWTENKCRVRRWDASC
ncbi:AAA family ATPase [Agrobacterium vitis]|nr:AAA family ATPase [Agrobacterium vitis]